MPISTEGKIGIGLGLFGLLGAAVGLAGAGLQILVPEYVWVGWVLIALGALTFAVAGTGGAALAMHHYGLDVKIKKTIYVSLAVYPIIGVLIYVIWLRGIGQSASFEVNITKVELAKPDNLRGRYTFNYYMLYRGKNQITEPFQSYFIHLGDHEPTKDDVESLYQKAASAADAGAFGQNETWPGTLMFNTMWGMTFSEEQIESVKSGREWLTIIIVLKYREWNTNGPYAATEYCGSFVGTFDFTKSCQLHNRIIVKKITDRLSALPPFPVRRGLPRKS